MKDPWQVTTDIVMAGEAIRGAEITVAKRVPSWFSIWSEVSPATVYGYITQATIPDGLPVFATTLASERGLTELQINHFGLSSTSTLRPDFIDTLASSDFLLVILSMLPLLAGVGQVAGALFPARRRKKREIKMDGKGQVVDGDID